VLPVKFDGRTSISVLRNEQLFTKNWGGVQNRSVLKKLKFSNLLNPAIWKKATPSLGKSLGFLGLDVFPESDGQNTIKFNIDQESLISVSQLSFLIPLQSVAVWKPL
jgi:hypothetical protein